MKPNLKVQICPGWRESPKPGGPLTYLRGTGPDPSTLQFSAARRRSVPIGGVAERLVAICQQATGGVKDRIELSQSSGDCEFGVFGTVTVTGSSPAYMQAWVLSNGHDFILITHICDKPPDTQEIKEAEEMAMVTGGS